MARYTGPKTKIARRFKDPIFGPDKALEKKNYGPGQHGPTKRRGGKQSEYSIQLGEKQKAKYTYGILEKQFSNMFEKASRMKGITGENLLQLCESRLDNVVFRLGVSPTRRGARQLVSHKHITVNGQLVNIPSYQLKPGDVVGVREKSKSLEAITGSLAGSDKSFEWLTWDHAEMNGTVMSIPSRELIPENIKEQLIVELYSK
ncbi:MAG: 30S ribosomal protein S4 [Flavobacteriales bacterium]|jgi:small subunit ribosomal protein S4|nr:30S ribosomal protein S4 [Flavobacteriales bacterium]MDA7762790.1 30S ribosomal protein S4 [Crocinitomicaceae bacterium]MBT5933381.1 30S ribosomal protein S4 [Flavobacteriales bacterium]MDC0460447.1 30S ribosomal protein S4 [Crocinitomicaceae bacterium]MDC1203387.1 30S ribosomal protein S4 [Crocinitomicaceae bacterium]